MQESHDWEERCFLRCGKKRAPSHLTWRHEKSFFGMVMGMLPFHIGLSIVFYHITCSGKALAFYYKNHKQMGTLV